MDHTETTKNVPHGLTWRASLVTELIFVPAQAVILFKLNFFRGDLIGVFFFLVKQLGPLIGMGKKSQVVLTCTKFLGHIYGW